MRYDGNDYKVTPQGKKYFKGTLQLEGKLTEKKNKVKKGSIVIPFAHDKDGEFIVNKVFKNKDGETSYTGKFKKSRKKKEFILHKKDKIVKESVNEGNLSEISGKKVKFNSRDWKKLNKLASKKKVMVKSGFGDYFTWDKADRDTVWVTDRYGKEYQLSHSEIDELRIQG